MSSKLVVIAGLLAVAAVASAVPPAPAVKTGIDVLVAENFKTLEGLRVGLITNPTGVTGSLRSTVDVLNEAPNVTLVALFGPEHGVRGDTPAGDHVADAVDARTGLPLYSLYGKNRRPTAEMLADIDALVFDIQDIGSRSYTFISTMAACLESAAEHGKKFVVLDRPNPLGGERIEGRVLDMKYKSFVGYLPIPYVHGMTVGELAKMIVGEGWLPEGKTCDLIVVPMRGWKRDMRFEQTGLAWVPPSPHVPRADSSYFYAATGIIGELRVLSEGVGYPLPFELLGAPGIEAEKFAELLNARKMPGVHFRPCYYQPYYASHKGEICGGVQVHLLEPDKVVLTDIGFCALDIARRKFGVKLPTEGRTSMFDKVCGTDGVRSLLAQQAPIEEVLRFWHEGEEQFRTQRANYLLYK